MNYPDISMNPIVYRSCQGMGSAMLAAFGSKKGRPCCPKAEAQAVPGAPVISSWGELCGSAGSSCVIRCDGSMKQGEM